MGQFSLLFLAAIAAIARAHAPGKSSFTVPSEFPTKVFSSYYEPPSATQEPQPAIHDPILNITFPLNLTDPKTIPTVDIDPVYYPKAIANISNTTAAAFIQIALEEIGEIIDGTNSFANNCSTCLAALSVGKLAAHVAPELVPDAMVTLCQATGFASNASCLNTYRDTSYGAIWTQVLAYADVTGLDGQYICASLSKTFCPAPYTLPSNTTGLFPKPKPANATAPKASGQRVKVLHLSDLHLDARYDAGGEANCSSSMCCRTYSTSSTPDQVLFPAPLYGSYKCDTPYDLALAALQAVGPLTGTGNGSFAWSIYTGDLVSHDSQNQLSRAYVEYTETSVYHMLKTYISGPIFPVLGNHDTNPEAIDGPHSLPGPLGRQFSWNYDHVSSLWQHEGWIPEYTAKQAALHYAAYSVKNHYGLRIITLNTDFWYKGNYLNFINTTDPDNSGQLKFLIDELQSAEDCGERVWILGHVLTGNDGTNPLPNPVDLFYQIVDRYSPHVIANIFWGHTHEDQQLIYYSNNGTNQSADTALTPGWIGPSITPLTNLNSGFRMYEVDTGSFDVYEAYTFYADVNSFPSLDNGTTGPVFQYEYSTRETYGPQVEVGSKNGSGMGWPKDAPLNATFWHGVTEAMERNRTLVEVFNGFQGKNSVRSPNCTSVACARAKVCYIRSGSVGLGRQCPQGFGSVQSPFSGDNF